jgi:RHH-type transcriptional regulator, rel operon repressor / antitoxin RelB
MHISSSTSLLTVRVRPEIADRLQKLSEMTDRSKSYVAAEAIEEYLDIHEWQINAMEEGMEAADKGEVRTLEEVKRFWEQKFEDKDH